MGSHGSEAKQADDHEIDDALQPVALPAPKPKPGKPGERVDTEHAPTVDQVLDPKRPDMEGASQDVLVGSIADTVDKIFQGVLRDRLKNIHDELAEVAPPPDEGYAGQIIGAIVEGIAIATLGVMGSLAAESIEATVGATASRAALDGVKAVGKDVGGAAKDSVKAALKSQQARAVPGADLLTEFLEREHLMLLSKQHDAIVLLSMVRASAAKSMNGDLAKLDDALRSLLEQPTLGNWFTHRVTMEWLNFCARLSIGPRREGQHTDMPGANTKGGLSDRAAFTTWHAATDGFVGITIGVGGGGDDIIELQFLDAAVNSGPGAKRILENVGSERDERGAPYTLATLPVYRRIYVKTGDTRLDEHPVFVITPEGAIEADLDDRVLARIGAGDAMQGARTITRLLANVGSEALR